MSINLGSAVIERKKSFIMAALDLLPEFEASLNQRNTYTYPFTMIVNILDSYPASTRFAPQTAKTLVYCADSLVASSLAVLWQGEITVKDIKRLSDLLESALDSICSVKNYYTT